MSDIILIVIVTFFVALLVRKLFFPRLLSESSPQVGASGIGPLYHFTSLPAVSEEAKVMRDMGATVHKFRLSPSSGQTLLDFFRNDQSTQYITKLGFSTLVMWSMPNINASGKGVIFKSQYHNQNYNEIYNLSTYLLSNFKNTKFLLGNWESDNALWGYCPGVKDGNIPPSVPYEDVIGYFSIRQKAVNDARKNSELYVSGNSAEVYHYAEVNCVQSAMKGYGRVINNVIPYTNPKPDFISYSSYDSLWPNPIENMLPAALKYISSKAYSESDASKVIIGEFGFQEGKNHYNANGVASQTNKVLSVANEHGVPIVLYWAVYDNEGPSNGRFWIIDDNNERKPVYDVIKNFISK
jgi:hypothetical protein